MLLLCGCQFPCRDHSKKFNLLQAWISSMVYIEDGSKFAHKIRLHQLSSGFTPSQRKTCPITSCIVQVFQCCLTFGTSVTIGQKQLSSAFTPAQRSLCYFQLYTARITMLSDIWHVNLGCLDGGTGDCGPLDGWSCTNR